RIRALTEARRVARPGGVVFAVGICRFASMFNGFELNLIEDPDFVSMVRRDLQDGQHRNPSGKPYFTTSYFHMPAELAFECEEAGLRLAALFGIEGPADYALGFSQWWDDAVKRELVLEFIRRVESEPSLLGLSSHLMAVGVKPD